MKKKLSAILGILLALAMMFAFAACNNKEEAATTEDTTFAVATDNDEMEYISRDGVRIKYNAKEVESSEIDEHTAQFVYMGESAGTNMMEVKYIADKGPEEVLGEVTEDWTEDPEKIERSEGLFPGTEDKWGYWRVLSPEGGKGLGMTAIAGEYNGGTLLFTITSTMSGKEDVDMAVSDCIAEMLDGVQYMEEFKDQTMYDYYIGTFKATKDNKAYKSITLKKDHNGVLTDAKGKKTSFVWGSTELTDDNGKDYEFTIEGNDLMMKVGNDWVEFTK